MRTALALLCLSLAACKKDAPAAPPTPATPPAPAATKVPTEVKADGALHAVQCQTVVAEWLGEKPKAAGAPLSAGVTGLRFRVGGKAIDFQSAGTLEAADWSFDIFSPDCERVALLQDVLGPVHVVKLSALTAYLEGGGVEAIIQKAGEGGASMVHGDLRWVTKDRLELSAACCGGVEVFQVNVATPKQLERTFFAAQAPKGIQHATDGGWELKP